MTNRPGLMERVAAAAHDAAKATADELGVTLMDVVIMVHGENVPADQNNAGIMVECESDWDTVSGNVLMALMGAGFPRN